MHLPVCVLYCINTAIQYNTYYTLYDRNFSVLSYPATNFASRRHSRRADGQGIFGCEQKAPLFTAFTDPLYLQDLTSPRNLQPTIYGVHSAVPSPGLEGKGLRRRSTQV